MKINQLVALLIFASGLHCIILQPSRPFHWLEHKDRKVVNSVQNYVFVFRYSSPCTGNSSSEGVEKQMTTWIESHCTSFYNNLWVKKVNHLKRVVTQNQISARRPKRDLLHSSLSDLLQNAVVATAGHFFGFAGSNLVKSVWDRVDPNSQYNRIGRLETSFKDQRSQLDSFEGQQKSALSSMANITRQQLVWMDEFFLHMQKVSWMISDIQSSINGYSDALDAVINYYMRGEVATVDLAHILGYEKLTEYSPQDSHMESIHVIDSENTLVFNFALADIAQETRVYEVRAIECWSDLAKSEVSRYNGTKFLVYNTTSNCAESLPEPISPYVVNTCQKPNHVDPVLLSMEKSIKRLSSPDRPRTQVIFSLYMNVIFCWPNEIIINDEQMSCPLYPFSLGTNTSFSTGAFRYRRLATLKLASKSNFLTNMIETNLLETLSPLRDPLNSSSIHQSLVRLEELTQKRWIVALPTELGFSYIWDILFVSSIVVLIIF